LKHIPILRTFNETHEKEAHSSTRSYFHQQQIPSSGHEVRPINNLFRPRDCIRLLVSLTVVQVYYYYYYYSQS